MSRSLDFARDDSALRQFIALVRFESKNTLKSIPFLIIRLIGVISVAGVAVEGGWLGAPYPLTRKMVDAIRFGYAIFALLIAAFSRAISSGASAR